MPSVDKRNRSAVLAAYKQERAMRLEAEREREKIQAELANIRALAEAFFLTAYGDGNLTKYGDGGYLVALNDFTRALRVPATPAQGSTPTQESTPAT